jgi:HAE1 family hydrophobic/amphiphilic exporter-1
LVDKPAAFFCKNIRKPDNGLELVSRGRNMKSVLRSVYKSGRVFAAASMVALLSGSIPVAALAQEAKTDAKGIVARQQSPAAQEKAAETLDLSNAAQTVVKPVVTKGLEESQQQPPQNPITQPLALSPDVPKTRIGVRDGQQELMRLQEAITRALQNNLDIEMARQDVQAAHWALFGSRGPYDFVPAASISYTNRTDPTTSVLQGGGVSAESVATKTLVYNFSLDHLVERTGTRWSLDFNNNRFDSGDAFTTINPRYNPSFTVSVTQPLMRNFKIDSFRQTIQLAKRSLDISDSQFRQMVINIISSVQRAYWDLVFARQNEAVARNAVELTRTQLDNNRKMVEAGTLAPIELRSTEAALESRKGTVIQALQSITTAENALKALIIKDPNDAIWHSEILPVDAPQLTDQSFSLDDSTAMALKNRPELDQLRLQVEQNEISQRFYKNQLKPQVDAFGFYTTSGTAGAVSVLPPNPDLPGGNDRVVPDRFRGGYFRALRNLWSFDFPTYQVGVSISFPWKNHTAEGNLGRSLAESRRLDARQRQLVQTVQIDVRNALQAVVATRQRFEAARAGRIAADAQLKGEQERFRAGLSSNFLVLERQNDFFTAEAEEVRALTDYNKALADLQRVTGMTLISNNVEVKSESTLDKK